MNTAMLPPSFSVFAALVFLSILAPRLAADEHDELKQLREQLRALEQKILVLERQQEIKDGEAAAAAKTVPKATVSDRGFTLASADGASSIKLRGLLQLDSRLFFNDHGIVNNSFILRRARLISEGTLGNNISFLLVPEFSGSSAGIIDAVLGIAVTKELQFKLGRIKIPVGLERSQSDSWTFFNERSIVTNLVPDHDLGILATGDLADGKVNYTVGIVGGVADGANPPNNDSDNDKDGVARVFVSPFRNDTDSPLQGLSFGVGGSLGRAKTASGRTAGYKTDGQQTFFSYNAATVADGPTWRFSPQFDYRHGPFGLLGEHVVSTVNVRPGATGPKAELRNKAWQLAAGYVLTGENSAITGVVPARNFDFANGAWGAFEIVARYASLRVDDAAFPLYASPSVSADEATSFGLGLNWYLSRTVRVTTDYYQTAFGFAPGAPAVPTTPMLQQDEKAFITRFQLAF